MATTTKPRGVGKFQKAKILAALRDTQTALMALIEDHETKLARWKEEAPVRFSEYVANYDLNPYFHISSFEPPKKNTACADWRIQALNKHIARVDAMNDVDGIVSILNSDLMWEYVGQAACL